MGIQFGIWDQNGCLVCNVVWELNETTKEGPCIENQGKGEEIEYERLTVGERREMIMVVEKGEEWRNIGEGRDTNTQWA